jgi:hypothetical protein
MKALSLSFLVCTGLVLGTAPQLRADFMATTTLTAAADNANSNGSGTMTLNYNAAMSDFTYTLSWMDLTGPATMAHIHLGAPGVAGPIVIPLFMTQMGASGSISGTLTQADVTPVNGVNTIADVAAAMQAGNTYANVHTMQYPAGEIRGQLAVSSSAVPEPRSIALLIVGALFAAGLLLRRARSV